MAQTRVAVLRGGPSEEYEVSMQTGASVLAALDNDEFEPRDVVVTKAGEWLSGGHAWYPERLLPHIDVAFIALHGAFGEDGKIQRILDRYGTRYTGSKAYPSSIAFHKVLTKDVMREHGVRMAPHMIVSDDSRSNLHGVSSAISSMFGPQYVIKPVASGSSIGTVIVENVSMLPQALDLALGVYDQVLVEKRIIGKEATCGVLNRFRTADTYVLPPIEIVPPQGSDFFDTKVKYDGTTKEICPGRFKREEKEEIERVARLAHEVLGLSQYSRSDFIVSDDGVYFLEVNNLPGLTGQSLLPKALAAVGSSYDAFVRHLVRDALSYR